MRLVLSFPTLLATFCVALALPASAISTVPEPASISLLALGAGVVAAVRFRKRR